MQFLKIIGIASLCLIFAIFLAIVTIPFIIDLDKYKSDYLPVIENRIGKKIETGHIGFLIWEGAGIRINDVKIYKSKEASDKIFANAAAVDVKINLLSILSGNIDIAGIVLNSPTFYLQSDKNLKYFLKVGEKESAHLLKPIIASFGIDNVIIKDAKIDLGNGEIKKLQDVSFTKY